MIEKFGARRSAVDPVVMDCGRGHTAKAGVENKKNAESNDRNFIGFWGVRSKLKGWQWYFILLENRCSEKCLSQTPEGLVYCPRDVILCDTAPDKTWGPTGSVRPGGIADTDRSG